MFKPYDQLTFSDNFLFCKILYDKPELCKELIETLLNIEVEKIEYLSKEYEIQESIKGHGIRLDVFVKNSDTVYDLEMQTSHFENLPMRSRYYQSMIDFSSLDKGKTYKEIPASYILFICTDDPFNCNLPKYEFRNLCKEDKSLELKDKAVKVFYNAKRWDLENNPALKEFLSFVNSQKAGNDFTKKLDTEVNFARQKEKWREEYVIKSLWETDILEEADKQAMEKGLQRGLEQGLEQGLERGLERGLEQGKLNSAIVAINALNISPEKASEVFGVNLETLNAELNKSTS